MLEAARRALGRCRAVSGAADSAYAPDHKECAQTETCRKRTWAARAGPCIALDASQEALDACWRRTGGL